MSGFGPAGAFEPPPPKSKRIQPLVGEPMFIPGNPIRNREILYRLIVSQLFYDGYQQLAIQLSSTVNADPPCPPSERLLHVVGLGLEQELALRTSEGRSSSNPLIKARCEDAALDMEYTTEITTLSPEPAQYETAYVTSHKSSCRAGAFNADGSLCATGSADASIKILDVDRMLAKSNGDAAFKGSEQGHPVIRTLYDHLDEVTCVDFHPRELILATGSNDLTVKIFDFAKASAKKAMRTLNDSYQVNSLAFHPSGDYLVVGTDHPYVRFYDVMSGACFVAADARHQHTQLITSVRFSPDGKRYASGSADGNIKIWDGVSSRCVNTFSMAHDGAEVCSLAFSKNGKYLLSSGKDSLVKLWELATSRCLIAYTGAGASGKQEFRGKAVFNHTEDFVLFPDENTTSLCSWDSRNASRRQLLSLGHNGVVRNIAHSPTDSAFLTCSDDFRARFWVKKKVR